MRILGVKYVDGKPATHLTVMVEDYPDDPNTKIAWVHSRWHIRKSPVRYLMFDASFTDLQILHDSDVQKLLRAYT